MVLNGSTVHETITVLLLDKSSEKEILMYQRVLPKLSFIRIHEYTTVIPSATLHTAYMAPHVGTKATGGRPNRTPQR